MRKRGTPPEPAQEPGADPWHGFSEEDAAFAKEIVSIAEQATTLIIAIGRTIVNPNYDQESTAIMAARKLVEKIMLLTHEADDD